MVIKTKTTIVLFSNMFGFCPQRARRHARDLFGIDEKSGQSSGKKRELDKYKLWSLFLSLKLTEFIGSKAAQEIASYPWFNRECRRSGVVPVCEWIEYRIKYSVLWKEFVHNMFCRETPWR